MLLWLWRAVKIFASRLFLNDTAFFLTKRKSSTVPFPPDPPSRWLRSLLYLVRAEHTDQQNPRGLAARGRSCHNHYHHHNRDGSPRRGGGELGVLSADKSLTTDAPLTWPTGHGTEDGGGHDKWRTGVAPRSGGEFYSTQETSSALFSNRSRCFHRPAAFFVDFLPPPQELVGRLTGR